MEPRPLPQPSGAPHLPRRGPGHQPGRQVDGAAQAGELRPGAAPEEARVGDAAGHPGPHPAAGAGHHRAGEGQRPVRLVLEGDRGTEERPGDAALVAELDPERPVAVAEQLVDQQLGEGPGVAALVEGEEDRDHVPELPLRGEPQGRARQEQRLPPEPRRGDPVRELGARRPVGRPQPSLQGPAPGPPEDLRRQHHLALASGLLRRRGPVDGRPPEVPHVAVRAAPDHLAGHPVGAEPQLEGEGEVAEGRAPYRVLQEEIPHPGGRQQRLLHRLVAAVVREQGREGVPREAGHQAAGLLHQRQHRVEVGPERVRQQLGPFGPVARQGLGHRGEAGDVGEQGERPPFPARLSSRHHVQDHPRDKLRHGLTLAREPPGGHPGPSAGRSPQNRAPSLAWIACSTDPAPRRSSSTCSICARKCPSGTHVSP